MRLLGAMLIAGLAACTRPPASSLPDTGTTETGPCSGYSTARRVGETPSALLELSGLVASKNHAGIYWAHNDSGQAFELFAIREDGTIAAQMPLTGGANVDIEDIGIGPCGAETCLFLGDFGDNRSVRASVNLYKLREPEMLTNDPRAVESVPFTYVDGAHNAESLVIDPANGTPYVLTKAPGTLGDVYKVENGSATKVATVTAPNNSDQVSTGTSVHPQGGRILVRTYGHLWELKAPTATSIDQVWAAEPVEVPSSTQMQSEAVAYKSDGRGYLIASEGTGEALFRVDCRE